MLGPLVEDTTNAHAHGHGVMPSKKTRQTFRSAVIPWSLMSLLKIYNIFKVTFALSIVSPKEGPYKKQVHMSDTLLREQREHHRYEWYLPHVSLLKPVSSVAVATLFFCTNTHERAHTKLKSSRRWVSVSFHSGTVSKTN